MGIFDFWKNKKEPDIVQPETVEQIVDEVVAEIHEETGEVIPAPVVAEVVDAVKELEDSVEEALLHPETAEEVAFEETTMPMESQDSEETEASEEEVLAEAVSEGQEAKENLVVEAETLPSEKPEEKKGFFAKLKEGLNKTRNNIVGSIDGVLGAFTSIDEDLFEELEEALIMADIGVETTTKVVENLRQSVKRHHTTNPQEVKALLIQEIADILQAEEAVTAEMPSPTVLLVIGVNGVGKTTTIGKLSHSMKAEGKQVMLAAADTFRAAAIDQLEVWGNRSGIPVIKHAENSDPAAVVFDAVHAAKNRKADILICDTAGRLHNKKNLMEELKKIERVIGREYPEAHKEVFLVLDATTGQNALQQAKLFREVADVTGIILTKLDGTAKGGIVIAIKNELGIPVRYVGVGEGISDLQPFDAKEFAEALFAQ